MTNINLSNMDPERYGCLTSVERVWAIGAIHGEARQLKELHHQLLELLHKADKIVYLGNYSGKGEETLATVDEILLFRRRVMSMPSVYMPEDLVYLRGAREEMFSKLLQLQFAPSPSEVMDWLLDHGMGSVIQAYGTKENVARAISREGTLSITKWTNSLRRAVQNNPGHYELMSHLRRAAFSDNGKLLFVHASLDPSRPLDMQKDHFWWDNGRFNDITKPFSGFARLIRGYDHANQGLLLDHPLVATVDGGCGRGGVLSAVCFGADGQVLDQINIQ